MALRDRQQGRDPNRDRGSVQRPRADRRRQGSDRRLTEEIDIKLVESFAEEARRRCDVIVAGLETGTNDYEALRAESHALKGTAAVVQLQRLAELAGLMESDLAEAAKTGQLRDNRIQQISDAAKALAEGAEAAAAGNEEPADVGRSLAQLFSA